MDTIGYDERIADWELNYGRGRGQLPPNSSEEAIAAWFVLETGIWPYQEPFFALPPEKGQRIRELLERNVSHRLFKQFEILDELKKIAPGQS